MTQGGPKDTAAHGAGEAKAPKGEGNGKKEGGK